MSPTVRRILVVLAGVAALCAWLMIAGSSKLDAGTWGLGGVAVFLVLLGSGGAGLALFAARPEWVVTMAQAYRERKTATMWFGVALIPVVALLLGIVQNAPPSTKFAVGAVLFAYVVVGFAGTAYSQGARLRRREIRAPSADDPELRTLIVGWTARSFLAATPFVWPAILAYVLITSLGTPLVGWLASRRRAAA